MNLLRAARAFAWAGVMMAALVPTGRAVSAELSITPLRIHLDDERPIQSWTVQNHGSEEASFEVRIKRWTQASDGRWELVESDGLVVNPLILSVAPDAKARIRVGTLSPAVEHEQAYRIELQELPTQQAASNGSEVRLLTRFSLPVFVQPIGAGPAMPVLMEATVDGSGFGVTLRNDGGRYLPRQDGRMRLLDATGELLHEEAMQVGYVLAGARLPLRYPLAAGLCRRVERVELLLPGQAPASAASVDAAARQCGE